MDRTNKFQDSGWLSLYLTAETLRRKEGNNDSICGHLILLLCHLSAVKSEEPLPKVLSVGSTNESNSNDFSIKTFAKYP